jgi:hypothetical protein
LYPKENKILNKASDQNHGIISLELSINPKEFATANVTAYTACNGRYQIKNPNFPAETSAFVTKTCTDVNAVITTKCGIKNEYSEYLTPLGSILKSSEPQRAYITEAKNATASVITEQNRTYFIREDSSLASAVYGNETIKSGNVK